MIRLYIPKKRWLCNNQYDLVDQEGRIFFQHRSNFFRTKRFIVNAQNEVVMNSKTVLGLKEKHVITRNHDIVAYVTYISVFKGGILVSQEGFSIKENKRMQFSVLKNQEEVLSITKSNLDGFLFMIDVKEEMMDFLIMLMFTIIVMLDNASSY